MTKSLMICRMKITTHLEYDCKTFAIDEKVIPEFQGNCVIQFQDRSKAGPDREPEETSCLPIHNKI